jgi:hypothetical protein
VQSACTAEDSGIVTNPKPRDLPVSRSVGMWHSNTFSLPYRLAKKSNNEDGGVLYDKFPMCSFIAGGRSPFFFVRFFLFLSEPLLLLAASDACECCGCDAELLDRSFGLDFISVPFELDNPSDADAFPLPVFDSIAPLTGVPSGLENPVDTPSPSVSSLPITKPKS